MARISNLPYVKGYQVVITTSGTPVQGTAYPVPDGVAVIVKAESTNTGTVTVAESSDNANTASTDNYPLLPNEGVGIQVSNTDKIWFDSTVSGDKVRIFFEYEIIN